MAGGEARAILDYLTQVVGDEAHNVVQLVFFVSGLHHLLKVLAHLLCLRRSLLLLFAAVLARLTY